MIAPICRACRARSGDLVLDLGAQPPWDDFPAPAEPSPDQRYPLRMWLCGSCGLAQLVEDPGTVEEPAGAAPAVLVGQAAEAVRLLLDTGVLRAGMTVAEYGSPHGGSWLPLLDQSGIVQAAPHEAADVVLDCFGMMHDPDQAAAIAARARRLAPGGTLLLLYHTLAAIVRNGQWYTLRHGHFAYYSTSALLGVLQAAGLVARTGWTFPPYGGTALLAAGRVAGPADQRLNELLAEERACGVLDPAVVSGLQRAANESTAQLRDRLHRASADGRRVFGYGAASRAVALLCRTGVDSSLLPAVADGSVARHGRRMPGTDIPIVFPGDLVAARPDEVLLFLPELLPEVRAALPEIEDGGGEWVLAT